MEQQKFLIAIGSIIRMRRKELRLSQERLAELCNLHPTYISEIERGKVNASIYCFHTIAHALGLEFTDFLLLPETPVEKAFDHDLSHLFNQTRHLQPIQKQLIMNALKGMVANLSD